MFFFTADVLIVDGIPESVTLGDDILKSVCVISVVTELRSKHNDWTADGYALRSLTTALPKGYIQLQ